MQKYEKVILIGAPRSGTNILRDVITRIAGVGTWPCDEINYIWRHGNRGHISDEFSPELATRSIKDFIHWEFDKIAKRQKLHCVIEKTCANSLRVGFVNQIFPDAKYIFLVRDGRDTIASSIKRWKAPLNISYTMRKARFVPLSDVPYYGFRFFQNRFRQVISEDKNIKYWGPVYKGMSDLSKTRSIAEVCALQWKSCINKSENDFKIIDPGQICRVKYEMFASNPVRELERILNFLGLETNQELSQITYDIHPENIGKWKKDLGKTELDLIMPLIENELIGNGYVGS